MWIPYDYIHEIVCINCKQHFVIHDNFGFRRGRLVDSIYCASYVDNLRTLDIVLSLKPCQIRVPCQPLCLYSGVHEVLQFQSPTRPSIRKFNHGRTCTRRYVCKSMWHSNPSVPGLYTSYSVVSSDSPNATVYTRLNSESHRVRVVASRSSCVRVNVAEFSDSPVKRQVEIRANPCWGRDAVGCRDDLPKTWPQHCCEWNYRKYLKVSTVTL